MFQFFASNLNILAPLPQFMKFLEMSNPSLPQIITVPSQLNKYLLCQVFEFP